MDVRMLVDNSIQRPVGKEDLMYYVGIDLHKEQLVVAVEDDTGPLGRPRRIACRDEQEIRRQMETLRPFCAVIEASSSYRWLYDLLRPLGDVILAHPLKLRAIVTARAKTDKLDAALLAKLLRAGLIPKAHIPGAGYQTLRDLTRTRARLSRAATVAKNQLHSLLGGRNLHSPQRSLMSKSARRWLREMDLGFVGNLQRDELLARLDHYAEELKRLDGWLATMAAEFPETSCLTDLHGVGIYTALLIVGEIAETERFANPRQVGAYAGLTARVNQSGGHCYYGHISRQGSSWLRWALVQAAMKLIRKDEALNRFYQRIRKRSSRHIARVAVARKLAGICWIRLRRWHRANAAA